jgi:hypothetical protein
MPDAKLDERATDALGSVPRAGGILGGFEPRRADHLQNLVDVLRNPPPAKPTGESLAIQLASPIALAVKSSYDLIASLIAIIKSAPGSDMTKDLLTLFMSILFVAGCVWVSSWMVKAYRDAKTKEDRHHARCLRRATLQLASENLACGEPLDPEDKAVFDAWKQGLSLPDQKGAPDALSILADVRRADTSPPEGTSP